MLCIADRKAQMRHVFGFACAIADLAFDDKNALAIVALGTGGKTVKIDAAHVHRQAKPGIEGRSLRHDPDHVHTPTDDQCVDKRQRKDARLQPR